MLEPNPMNTISQVLQKLNLNGIDTELEMSGEEKMHNKKGKIYTPEDLKIIKTYRFEGESDPGDNSVIYILEDKEGLLSFILDQYGMYSDHDGPYFDDFLKQIPTEDRDEQELFKTSEE